MPVTLAQAKLNSQTDIQAGVVDEFRKSSYILDNITFDDSVSPGTQGKTLTYGYTRLLTQPTAAFRAINEEYAPQEVQKVPYSVELKPFGGSYEIDRVVADTGGLVDEIELQQSQKIKAAKTLFHDAFINGDSAVNAKSFDGLDKAVAGSSTEFGTGSVIDLSSETALNSNQHVLLDFLGEWLSSLSEKPTFLGSNSKLINRIKSAARRAGYLTKSEDSFGRSIEAYDGIPLLDLGEKSGSSAPIVPIRSATVGGTAYTGLADLYAAVLSLNGVHGVSLQQDKSKLVKVWLPDFSTAGAVKKGEVEIVGAIAIKQTKQAGVARNFKVQ